MGHCAVLGAGAWGTALARVMAERSSKVTLWTWQRAHAERMRQERENKAFFPDFELSEAIVPTSSFAEALDDAEIVVVALPSHVMRANLLEAKAHFSPDAIVVSATKGIENDSLRLMTEVIEESLGEEFRAQITALSGPSFAKEVALGMPTNIVLAATERGVGEEVQTANRHRTVSRVHER